MNGCLFFEIFTVAITMVAVVLVLAYRRLKRKYLRLEQQLLLSQLNPHFVFNSLTAIQSYVFRNEAHLASKYLASFAKLTRLILENSRSELCSIENEVATLEHYLELQSLRFSNRFDYSIYVDEKIDADSTLIPPMLTQPFIENAIEHGFNGIEDRGKLTISYLYLDKHHVEIEVKDNGVGIKRSEQANPASGKDHLSLATEITLERLKNIRHYKRLNIILTLVDTGSIDPKQHGTLVKFKIPI